MVSEPRLVRVLPILRPEPWMRDRKHETSPRSKKACYRTDKPSQIGGRHQHHICGDQREGSVGLRRKRFDTRVNVRDVRCVMAVSRERNALGADVYADDLLGRRCETLCQVSSSTAGI